MENDVDTLHEEIEHLVGHSVRNDVDILHEERIHLARFNFIYEYMIRKTHKQSKVNEI